MTTREVITGMITQSKPSYAPVEETSDLYADLGFDSLGFVALLFKIETACAVSIDIVQMGQCLRVDRLIALVEQKVREAMHDSTLVEKSK